MQGLSCHAAYCYLSIGYTYVALGSNCLINACCGVDKIDVVNSNKFVLGYVAVETKLHATFASK